MLQKIRDLLILSSLVVYFLEVKEGVCINYNEA
jgi:hypothetical protein